MKTIKYVDLTQASLLLGGVVGLKDTNILSGVMNNGDLEELTAVVDADLAMGYTPEIITHGMHGAATAAAVFSGIAATPLVTPSTEGMTLMPDLEDSRSPLAVKNVDLEYFEGKNPNAVQPFAFALAANTMGGDAGLSLMYPTVNVPANVDGVILSLVYGNVKTKFKRDDPTRTGASRMDAKSVLTGLRDPSVVRSNANLLVPVNNALNAKLLDLPFKNDAYVHPTTGEKISTAPIKFGKRLDLTSISHTAKLLSDGVFGDETSLDVGGHISALYGSIGSDKFKFDISTLPMNEITGGPSGDAKDLIVNISTEMFTVDPALIKTFSGGVSAELTAVPVGLRLIYALDVSGSGNMATCDFNVLQPSLNLIQVVDVLGNPLDITAGDGLTAYNIGIQLELTSYDLKQTVTNADLRIIANVIDVGEIGQRVGISYGAVDAYEKTILTESKLQRSEALLSIAVIRAIARSSDLKIKAIQETVREAATFVNGGLTKTITSTALNAYYAAESLDLAVMLDGEEHSKREEDIAALIGVKIKGILPALLYETNYAALSKAYGKSMPGIGVTFGTDLLPFMPKEIVVAGVIVKIAMTEVDAHRSDIFVYPIDPDHSPYAKTITPLNLGLTLTKPDIVITGTFEKMSGTFVIPRTRVVNTCSILHKFEVANITAALNKITSNVSK